MLLRTPVLRTGGVRSGRRRFRARRLRVVRALALPEIAACRARLVPEVPVYGATSTGAEEQVTIGIADAIAFAAEGTPQVLIDWKSDIYPPPRPFATTATRCVPTLT